MRIEYIPVVGFVVWSVRLAHILRAVNRASHERRAEPFLLTLADAAHGRLTVAFTSTLALLLLVIVAALLAR